MATATTNPAVPPTLSLDHRNSVLRFEDANGTIRETCVPINWSELYNLKGRLLTLCDASFSDQQQRKAFKDCLWQSLQHWMRDIEKSAGYDGFEGIGVDSDEPKGI